MNSKLSANKLNPVRVAQTIESAGCFDLQFRRDVKTTRPGSPVYYSWKTQFIIPLKLEEQDVLEKLCRTLKCGAVHLSGNVARYSVQDIESLHEIIVPFIQERIPLQGKKKQDFELWAEAVYILYQNKNQDNTKKGVRGFTRTKWKKKDFQRLLQILEEIQPYKARRKTDLKWVQEAHFFAQTLK